MATRILCRSMIEELCGRHGLANAAEVRQIEVAFLVVSGTSASNQLVRLRLQHLLRQSGCELTQDRTQPSQCSSVDVQAITLAGMRWHPGDFVDSRLTQLTMV
jgi:hypothetical protein